MAEPLPATGGFGSQANPTAPVKVPMHLEPTPPTFPGAFQAALDDSTSSSVTSLPLAPGDLIGVGLDGNLGLIPKPPLFGSPILKFQDGLPVWSKSFPGDYAFGGALTFGSITTGDFTLTTGFTLTLTGWFEGSIGYTDSSAAWTELLGGVGNANLILQLDPAGLAPAWVDLNSLIIGTTNQVIVTDGGLGNVSLSTPQDIHSGASPTFAGLIFAGSSSGLLTLTVPTAVTDYTITLPNIVGQAGQALIDVDGAGGLEWHNVSGASLGGEWKFSTTTAMADPSSKFFRLNNGTQGSSTAMAISHTTNTGFDAGLVLSLLNNGDRIIIQQANDASRFHAFDITVVPVDNTTWSEVALSNISSGADLQNNQPCAMIFLIGAVGGGGVTGSGTAGRVTLWTGASTIADDAGLAYVSATDTLTILQATPGTGGLVVDNGTDTVVLSKTSSGLATLTNTSATQSLRLGTNSTNRWDIFGATGHLVPVLNDTYDIGTSSLGVRDVHVSRSVGIGVAASGVLGGINASDGTRTLSFVAGTGILRLASTATTSVDVRLQLSNADCDWAVEIDRGSSQDLSFFDTANTNLVVRIGQDGILDLFGGTADQPRIRFTSVTPVQTWELVTGAGGSSEFRLRDITAGNNLMVIATTGAISLTNGTGSSLGIGVTASGTSGRLDLDSMFSTGDVTVGGKLTVTGIIDPTGLVLTEQAVDPATPAAGFGTLWVRSDTPNILIFTDDTSVENVLSFVGHVHDAGDITTGTFANARISEASVTQHEAALTILESQITDGSTLARVAGTEIITGGWEHTLSARFNTSVLRIDNPAQTVTYRVASSAIVANRTITLPLLTGNDVFVFESHTQTLANKTLTTPTIASFTNAQHDHSDAAGGGALSASAVTDHEGAIDHDALLNFVLGEHFTEASIDHTAILNIGTNSHAAIDTHIADGTIHFALSGTAGRVTLWTGATTLGDDADLLFSGATLTVGAAANGILAVTSHANFGSSA
ncbi:MAG: hypothetical protein V3S19_01165, partial [Gemmatimonadales bacterium]